MKPIATTTKETSMADVETGIREITIENFRGIERLQLSFVGPRDRPTATVVLGGPNGCGKTSVLEACLVACGQEKLLKGKHGRAAVRHGADDYRIRAIVQVGNESHEIICGSGRTGPQFPCVYFSSWRAPTLIGPVPITAGRKGRRPEQSETNRLWTIKQHLVNARAHELFQKRAEANGYSQAIERLNWVWQHFYSDQRFTVEPASDEPDAGFDLFLVGEEHQRLSVDDLSSGQLEVLAFAGVLLQHRGTTGLLVIDEPELHLDPQWHAVVLKLLGASRPRWQVIAATHSPDVYESAYSFERHFLLPADDPRAKAWPVRRPAPESGG